MCLPSYSPLENEKFVQTRPYSPTHHSARFCFCRQYSALLHLPGRLSRISHHAVEIQKNGGQTKGTFTNRPKNLNGTCITSRCAIS